MTTPLPKVRTGGGHPPATRHAPPDQPVGVPPSPRLWGHAYCRWQCRGRRGRRVPLIRRLRMGGLLPGSWGAESRGWLLVPHHRALRSQMKTNLSGRHVSLAAVLVTASLVTAACSSPPVTVTNPAAPKPLASGSWPYSNGDLSNTRNAAGSTITSANVSRLKQAWTFHITGSAAAGVGPDGALAANPIVVNGVVYIQDLDSNVYALALATGKLKWEYQLNTPMKTGPGPDGVAVAGGMVYGVSPTSVFALNARTGKKIWVNSHLLGKGQGTFEIQPQVADGRVYLASGYGLGP